MKYLKGFEKDIDYLCYRYHIKNYTVNADGSLDVTGDVKLDDVNIFHNFLNFDIKFRIVTGSFYCHYNRLKSLEGSPIEVGGDFHCYGNGLTTLEGSPKEIGGDFLCNKNQLINLKGSPKSITGLFDCSNNILTTLEGSPITIDGDFNCGYNQLTTLEGGPKKVTGSYYCYKNHLTTLNGSPRTIFGEFDCGYNRLENLNGCPDRIDINFTCVNNKINIFHFLPTIGGYFNIFDNPVQSLRLLFKKDESFIRSLDWKYLRGTTIIKSRFREACIEANIKMPDSISGYDYK